jgi:hypothetical protein
MSTQPHQIVENAFTEDRRTLLHRLYECKKPNYNDVRQYRTPSAITKRVEIINTQMHRIDARRRNHTNIKYKKLWLEKRMLLWKLELYKEPHMTEPSLVTLNRALLQLSECKQKDDGGEGRAEHTVLLMQFMMCDKDDNTLKTLIDF